MAMEERNAHIALELTISFWNIPRRIILGRRDIYIRERQQLKWRFIRR